VAGARVVIYNPKGKQEATFEWGLGYATNNKSKALALLQGINQFDSLWRKRNLGDSTIIIKFMHNLSTSKDGKLARIIKRIQKELRRFEHLEYFHILRATNKWVNQLENLSSSLVQWVLKCKTRLLLEPIP